MKVTYVFHSCYTVELERYFLIFDYYKGTLPPFPAGKQVIFFVSHSHYDHFFPDLFAFAEAVPDCLFVLHREVPHPERPGILTLGCNETLSVGGLSIHTLRSTDEGVAFLLRVEGLTLYHAGDLNWWHWEGAPEKENQHHKRAFFHELEKVRGMTLDLAFLPLDPRQEENAWWGVKAFLDAVPVAHAFPIHFGDKISEMNAYLHNELRTYPCLMPVSRSGESFVL